METINVVIAADGSLSYEVRGVKGSSCKALTKAIDQLAAVTETKNTREYCEIPQAQSSQLKQGR